MTRTFSRALAGALGIAGIAACASAGVSKTAPVSAPTAPSAAGSAASCPACVVDATRYLRELSLDLRGRPPSDDELARVAAIGEVPEAMIDAMIASDEFVEQAKAWHMPLLWPNLDGFHVRAAPIVGADFDDKTGRRAGGTFSPDPALLDDGPAPKGVPRAKRKRPHGFVMYADNNVTRTLRGENQLGCDATLEYPAPAPEGKPQPSYSIVGSDKKTRKYSYYDDSAVPLPFHDAAHCPNYCSSKTDAERAAKDYKKKREDFAPMNAPIKAAKATTATVAGANPKAAAQDVHELDPAGMRCPESHPYRVVNRCDNVHSANDPEIFFRERREGYRSMKHYWSGATEVRTCAYEAQDRTASAKNGTPCASSVLRDPSCGCGPDGIYCMPAVNSQSTIASRAEHLVREALNEEPIRIVASVIGADEDYFEIFRTRRSFVNGPLAFFYKRQMTAAQGIEMAAPAPPEAIPDLPYQDTSFHEVVRNPEHAGVLTTAAYLGRFPTWRSRVSQFRTAFMCRPFTPGSASLPASDDACTREPNLAKRCGCKNCHSALEPMTAWFGRWAERSTMYLSPEQFPAFDPYCQQCALTGAFCSPRCRQQYVTSTVDADGARYAGTLRGYLYRTDEEKKRIDEGPQGLVASAIASGELEACTVRTAWSRLLGRPMSDAEMNAILPELTAEFDAGGRSYKKLVKAIVTSPAYRRVD